MGCLVGLWHKIVLQNELVCVVEHFQPLDAFSGIYNRSMLMKDSRGTKIIVDTPLSMKIVLLENILINCWTQILQILENIETLFC